MDIERTLNEALELGDEGRWPEMVQLLESALVEERDDPNLLCWLGVAHRELGQDGIAYDYFKRCWAEDPLDPQLLAMCGAGLAAFDDPDAEAALRAAVLSGPDEIGRASCRERVKISVVAGSLKKKVDAMVDAS